ncbi:hypothetical protein BLOT_004436 [Blomia tropicalis]|nr:hypothetical protein BLOT_004436 [Blomia tropicalis]
MKLTDLEKERLEKRLMVRLLSKQGANPTEISRQTGLSRSNVYRWINRESIYNNEPRKERPKKITDSVKKMIEDAMKDKANVGTRTVVKQLNKAFEEAGSSETISRSTIRRYLKTTEWGSTAKKVKNKKNNNQRTNVVKS